MTIGKHQFLFAIIQGCASLADDGNSDLERLLIVEQLVEDLQSFTTSITQNMLPCTVSHVVVAESSPNNSVALKSSSKAQLHDSFTLLHSMNSFQVTQGIEHRRPRGVAVPIETINGRFLLLICKIKSFSHCNDDTTASRMNQYMLASLEKVGFVFRDVLFEDFAIDPVGAVLDFLGSGEDQWSCVCVEYSILYGA